MSPRDSDPGLTGHTLRRHLAGAGAFFFALAAAVLLLIGPWTGQSQGRSTGPRPVRTFATFSVSRYLPAIPWAGPISTVTTRPGDDNDVLAASDSKVGTGTIFSSSDGGTSWTQDTRFPPAATVQSVAYDDDAGGWRCVCILATTAPVFEASGGGGLYESNSLTPPRLWAAVPNIFPTPSADCPARPAAHDISIAPDAPHAIYVGTDCGVTILTPAPGVSPSVNRVEVVGAPNQEVDSLLALPGGHLIVGGPSMGVWFYSPDNGGSWNHSGLAGGGTFPDVVQSIHAFASDPRDGNKAYVIANQTSGAEQLQLFETLDAGATWHPVTVHNLAPVITGCGGIPNVHAVIQASSLHLYVGDPCAIKTASVPLDQEPWSFLGDGSWSDMPSPHSDTRDIAFHSGTNAPYFISSDGGIARSLNGGSSFDPIGPASGLDALQIDEINGELPVPRLTPELYFATWHTDIWSMRGTTSAPANSLGGEGLDLGMPALGEGNMVMTTCTGCGNYRGTPHWTTVVPWHNAEVNGNGQGISNPIFISPGRYGQAVDRFDPVGGTGIDMTTDLGNHWHRIANFPDDSRPGSMRGWLRPAGPETDPILYVPTFAARHSGDTYDTLGLATISHLSMTAEQTQSDYCDRTSFNCLTRQRMNNFGSLGVTPTDMGWYPVYATDALDRGRLIAADVTNNDVRYSTSGGATWNPIPGFARQITNGSANNFSIQAGGERAPALSVISICPWDDTRVLAGTRLGGAFFSFDGGMHWTSVLGSEEIVFATSIYWTMGCGSAYVGTYGRGIFKVDMAVHTQVITPHANGSLGPPCDPPVCRLEGEVGHRISGRHPLPGGSRGLIVSDGYITAVKRGRKSTLIKVSAGSVVTLYRGLPSGAKIVHVPARRRAKGVIQAVFFVKHRLVRELRGSPLTLYPLKRKPIGRGLASPPPDPDAVINLIGYPSLYGDSFALVPAGTPLTIDGTVMKAQNDPVKVAIDGVGIAEFPAGVQKIDFSYDGPVSIGDHDLELVTAGNTQTTLASTPFAVVNGDEGGGK